MKNDIFPKKRIPVLGYGIISAIAFTVMVAWAGKQSLWFDDLVQINISQKNLFDELFNEILRLELTPPLFGLFAALWLKIAPYGTAFLKLPSAIAVAVGILICGLAGYRIRKAGTGFICVILAATSATVLYNAGLGFRAYGFFFMFSCLAVFLYIDRYTRMGKETKLSLVAMSIAFTLLIYTHYFGILMLTGFFLSDIILFIKRKIGWKCFIPYLVAFLLFSPWLLYGLIPTYIRHKTFWASTPNWQTLLDTMKYFASGSFKINIFYIIAMLTVAFSGIFLIIKRKFSFEKHYIYAALIFTFVLVMLIPFIYSVYINPATSVYVERYFLGIISVYYVLVACGIDIILSFVLKKTKGLKRAISTAAILVAIAVFIATTTYSIFYRQARATRHPWEKTAEWLMAKEDIYNKNVLVVLSTWGAAIGGFKYYLTHDGRRKGIDVANSLDAETLHGIDKIYYCVLHNDILDKSYIEEKFHFETAVYEVPVKIYTRF